MSKLLDESKVLVVKCPNGSVVVKTLPRESYVFTVFPRTEQVEHADPCEIKGNHFPAAFSDAKDEVLPSESVRLIEEVRVNTGPMAVFPATVTATVPVAAPVGTTAAMDVSLQLVMVVAGPP